MKKSKLPVIDKKNFPYTLVIVYWEDIVGDASWVDITDIKKPIKSNLIDSLDFTPNTFNDITNNDFEDIKKNGLVKFFEI